MSQAQLETQIQRKRTELEILTKDQTALESAKHDLSEEYKERNENYERLRERLEQANQEIDQSEREILQLNAELVAMRNQGNDDAAASEELDAEVRGKLSDLSPQDCLDQLMKEMAKTAQIMKDPAASRAGGGGDPASGPPGSGSSGGGEQGGGAASSSTGLTQVAIHFERIQEFASFQLTSRYTFSQLCDDACRYWGVDPQHGTLRDAHNVMWPPQAVISLHLAERLELDGFRPVVRLVSRQQGAAAGGGEGGAAGGDGGGGGMRARNKSKRGDGSGAINRDVLEDANWALDSDEEDSDEDDSLALIKEWRRMVNEEMSPFFHLPRYAGKRSKFRSLNSNSSSAKQLSEKCATWCKLLMHAVFVFLVTLTLFYRRRVVTSYDAAHSLKTSLIHQPFDGGLNFTAAPFALDFEHMHSVDDFWAWMQGPMLNTALPQLDASGRLLVPGERDFSLHQNKIMGGVRMRQYRAGSTLKTGGCIKSTVVLSDGVQIGDAGVVQGRECFAEYSMDRQRMYVASLSAASFSNGGEAGQEGFTHSMGNILNARPVVTHTSYYDRSSFAVELPADRGRALRMIWALRDSIWIDRGTRAVILDFNVLNLNYYTMTAGTLVVDFTPGGPIATFHSFDTVTLSMVSWEVLAGVGVVMLFVFPLPPPRSTPTPNISISPPFSFFFFFFFLLSSFSFFLRIKQHPLHDAPVPIRHWAKLLDPRRR
mgnify:CR=1 FL=1